MDLETVAVAACPAPALEALRSATRQQHSLIEAQLQLGSSFGLAHYHRCLLGFASFLAAWEPQVARALPPAFDTWFLARRRGALLRRDLQALELEAPGPLPDLPIGLEAPGAVWGSLYVMEGSALGGQVIAARLRAAHGIGPTNGGAYFGARGETTGPLWREFRQQLERELRTPALQAAACRAAVQTFAALAAAFGKAAA